MSGRKRTAPLCFELLTWRSVKAGRLARLSDPFNTLFKGDVGNLGKVVQPEPIFQCKAASQARQSCTILKLQRFPTSLTLP